MTTWTLTSGLGFPKTNGNKLSVASSSTLNVPTGSDVTWECWMNSTSGDTTGNRVLFSKRRYPSAGYAIDIGNTTGQLRVNVRDGTNDMTLGTIGPNVNDGLWHHIAFVRNSAFWWIFVDGIAVGSKTDNITGTTSNTIQFEIGDEGAQVPYVGSIDEFRWSLTARYPSGTTFTPGSIEFTSDAQTMGLWHLDSFTAGSVFADSSSNNNSGSLNIATFCNGYVYSGTEPPPPPSANVFLVMNKFSGPL